MSFHEDGVADLLSTIVPLSEKYFFFFHLHKGLLVLGWL